MNPIKSLMGRRQFLAAASATSALGLGCKGLSDIFNLGIKTGVATGAERSGAADVTNASNRFRHLLSPLKIRNKVLKNRMLYTPATPMRLGGPERYPTDQLRSFYSEIAKNAAVVSVKEHFMDIIKDEGTPEHQMTWEDTPTVRNYLDQMIEDIHCEDSLICCGRVGGGGQAQPGGGQTQQGRGQAQPGGVLAQRGSMNISSNVEDYVTQAKQAEDAGYDMVEVGERDFTNVEAVRGVIKGLEAVRKATNILILAVILPYTPGKSRPQASYPGNPPSPTLDGPEMEELVEMAKMLDGVADIIRMKDIGHATNHPNSFTMEKGKPWMLPFSEAIKESGAKIIVCPTGGFHDPELNDQWIASGKADMVGVATPLIADPEYVKKLSEGRGEDRVPCVMCHDCHNRSRTLGPWFMTCSVNPMFGLSETKKKSIRPPLVSKKVAVIGGGPAGMKAAITAAERGHKVTLYEKDEALGGLQRHTDFTPYKWSYKDFKDYLIRQTYKAGVDVRLKTTATPDMIKAKGYDTVLAATGAEPVVPKIPGADGKNVYDIFSVYSNKKSLGKNVVFIGGGLFATEAGIGLALDGYKVTELASGKEIPFALIQEEYVGSHNSEIQLDIALNNPNFSYVLDVIATRITEGKVFYKEGKGTEKSIQADSVAIYAGLKPKMDDAMKFSGSAHEVLLLGDCTGKCGMLYKTIRSALFKASQV